jgi:hypothetical protein
VEEQSIPALIEKLGSKRKYEYQAAEATLNRLGIDALEPLLEVWKSESGRYRRNLNLALPFLLSSLIPLAAAIRVRDENWRVMFPSFVLCFATQLIGCRLCGPPKEALSRIGSLISSIDDIRALGPLTGRFTGAKTTADLRQGREMAARLFLKVRASDSALITQEVRDHIHYVLKHWQHFDIGPGLGTDYYCAVLSALVQVGDERSIPYVRRVVETAPPSVKPRLTPINLFRLGYNGLWLTLLRLGSKGKYRTIDRKRLAEAAQECLSALEARSEDEREAGVLLRPSSASAADSLLRPATSSRQQTDELLISSSRPTGD